MTLQALKFPPGIVRVGTDGMARGRWWDCNLMRWRNGGLVPIGGWDRLTSAPMAGPARKMLAWRSSINVRYVAIGTDTQLLLLDGDQLIDKTPDGFISLPGGGGEGGYGTGKYDVWTYDTPRPEGSFGPGGNPYSRGSIWSLDTWGEDMLAVASSDGRLLHMSPNSTDASPAFDAKAVPVATAPVNNRAMVVTDERYVMLIGAGGKPRMVAWCSREDFNNWDFADPQSTAGFIELDTQSTLINAVKVRGGVLIWTEKEVWLATYKGLPAIYGFECIGESCGMLGASAFAVVAGNALWCGFNTFWSYTNGVVAPVPCDVADYLFRRVDIKAVGQRMTGGANGRFTEAWFLFPEAGHTENNAYVMTNYVEGWWAIGHLDRSCIDGAGVWPVPLMGGADGHLYQHESGWLDAGATRNGSVWIESAAQQMPPGGDRVLNILGAQLDNGSGYDAAEMVAFTRETHDDPVEYLEGPFAAYSDGWVECRFSGRDIRIRFNQIKDQHWSLGEARFDIVPGRGR